jgi:hypothetical protein
MAAQKELDRALYHRKKLRSVLLAAFGGLPYGGG